MQLQTHALLIRAAIGASGVAWLRAHADAIEAGCADEDVWLLGPLRLRAPGLSHTYRPGRARGELGAPSALSRMLCYLERAHSAPDSNAARWLGRACHLLGDMAVPARTRGVWHWLGDPLETWCERNPVRVAELAAECPKLSFDSPRAIADSLALTSAALDADTTRTAWGRVRHAVWRHGKQLTLAEIVQQAELLIPLAAAHTRALLEHQVALRE